MTKRTIADTSEEIDFEWTEFASRRCYRRSRLKSVDSSVSGHMQDARYNIDRLRHRKTDKNGNSSEEYGVGISTAASASGSSSLSAPSISWISGRVILGAEIDGTFVFHLGDALSTVRDVVDDSGAVIKSFEFDEYGNLLDSSGTGTTSPKTWIGGLSVNDDRADSGMFNMGHRNYAAGVLGRFISRDPIGHDGDLNLYAYPTNPVDRVDPSGLQPTPKPSDYYNPPNVTTWRGTSISTRYDGFLGEMFKKNRAKPFMTDERSRMTEANLQKFVTSQVKASTPGVKMKWRNCHSYALNTTGLIKAEGGSKSFWIDEFGLLALLNEANKHKLLTKHTEANAECGDLVFYHNAEGKILHSGVVESTSKGIRVTSDWGDGGLYSHPLLQTPSEYLPAGGFRSFIKVTLP